MEDEWLVSKIGHFQLKHDGWKRDEKGILSSLVGNISDIVIYIYMYIYL